MARDRPGAAPTRPGCLIVAPDDIRLQIPSVSTRTLYEWRTIRRRDGDDALGIDRRGRPAKIEAAADGAVVTALLGAIAKQSFLSADQLGAYLRDRFGDALPEISERTIQRARTKYEAEHRNALLAIRDPDKFRSTVEHSATNSTFAAGLNDLWQIDASPADVMLAAVRCRAAAGTCAKPTVSGAGSRAGEHRDNHPAAAACAFGRRRPPPPPPPPRSGPSTAVPSARSSCPRPRPASATSLRSSD